LADEHLILGGSWLYSCIIAFSYTGWRVGMWR